MYLAADVGGTKVVLSAFTLSNVSHSDSEYHRLSGSENSSSPQVLAQAEFASADFTSLEACIQAFQAQFQLSHFKAACLGLPAPITQFPLKLTNLDWVVEPSRLKRACHIEQLYLLNDFTVAAWGVEQLCEQAVTAQTPQVQWVALQLPESKASDDLPAQLNSASLVSSETSNEASFSPPKDHRLVVGAGTGLGVAPIALCGAHAMPLASEGGHMDFAPNQVWQQKLLTYLWKSWFHASYERILSGPGLQKLYAFWQSESGDSSQPLEPEEITDRANAGEALAVQTLESFVSIYGSYIGNLGLFWPARGGIFIAGGIASKILPWMQSTHFLEALHAKGRMAHLTQQWPIWVVTDPALGVKGAMFYLQQQVKL